jgi:hypothetical protein
VCRAIVSKSIVAAIDPAIGQRGQAETIFDSGHLFPCRLVIKKGGFMFRKKRSTLEHLAGPIAATILLSLCLSRAAGGSDSVQAGPRFLSQTRAEPPSFPVDRVQEPAWESIEPEEGVAVTLRRHDVVEANGWAVETVDEGVDGSIDLTLDGDGNAHISYDAGALYCAKQGGGDWDRIMVDSSAYHTSIAVDPQGYDHILYFESNARNDTLRYAYEDGEGWHLGAFDLSAYYVGRYNELALDESGQAHMTFSTWRCMAWVGGRCISWDPDQLLYLHPVGAQWQIMVAGYSSEYGSLALDAAGEAHISFYNAYNDILKYTCYDIISVYPTSYAVDESADVGRYTSVGVDSQYTPPRPHLAYYDADHGDLKYAYGTGPDVWHLAWYSETVDTGGAGGDVGQYTSLALDGDGYPHISYYDVAGGNLKYTYEDEDGWHPETVDDAGDVGRWSSLAIDGEGNVHIAYYDATNDAVKYACKASDGDAVEHVVYLPLVVR